MPGNIFISYRRDDAAAWAGRLHMALERQFRRDQLFMDVDSIQPGLDFAKVIDVEVAKCDVMLVVIGKGWVDARDAGGRRRLDDASDFVRLEVESALRRDIRVVPVLVDGASMPKAEELPEGMRGLVRRQAWPLSHARFGAESEGLIGEISRHVTPGGGGAAAARTDWAGEASWFFFYLLGGICLIAAVVGLGMGEFYMRFGGRFPNKGEGMPWFGLALGTATTLLVAGAVFAKADKLRVPGLTAAWITSSFGAFAVGVAWLGFGADLLDTTKNSFGFVMFLLGGLALAYAFLSGPALILWRRRKRRG